MNRILKVLCPLLLLIPLPAYGISESGKQSAEKRIVSCYSTDLSGKGCTPQSLLKDGNTLLSSYRAGDRSVLASLMRVNALSVGLRSLDCKFFAQAMLDDLDGFLSALSSTQNAKDAWLNSEAIGSACDCSGISLGPFNEIRGKLRNVRHDSASFSLAEQCRRDLEDTNATLLVTYFPQNAFASPGGDFMVQWYSGVFYELGEKPLWPANPKQVTYRFVWIRSFHDPVSITMDVQPGGTGQLHLHINGLVPRELESKTQALSKQQAQEVLELIDRAGFWNMATEGGPHGNDGAEWILEGVQGGQYHVVTRWDASGTAFGKALLELIRLSNYNPPKNEIY